MKRAAATVAIIGFFVLAVVGWVNDVPVHICALRALAGAGALYVVLNLAVAAAIRIIVDAAIKANRKQVEAQVDET